MTVGQLAHWKTDFKFIKAVHNLLKYFLRRISAVELAFWGSIGKLFQLRWISFNTGLIRIQGMFYHLPHLLRLFGKKCSLTKYSFLLMFSTGFLHLKVYLNLLSFVFHKPLFSAGFVLTEEINAQCFNLRNCRLVNLMHFKGRTKNG